MIKQLLELAIAKYRDLSVSRKLAVIDLLATDKSRYFAIAKSNICLAFLRKRCPRVRIYLKRL